MVIRILVVLFFAFFSNPKLVRYHVMEGSNMLLRGKTNVKDFKCICEDDFENASLTANFIKGTNFITFNKAIFNMKIKSLNCNNKFLNDDIYTSLKADKYPNISVELLSASPLHDEEELVLNKKYNYQIHTNISIAGKTKQQNLDVILKKTKPSQFEFTSNKIILMSDYSIDPKSPIKFIKINDEVSIHFDLEVEIQ